MRDREPSDGGQLREGMRPDGDVKAGTLQPCAQVHQHVMTGVMAEGHEEGAEKDPPPGALPQARRQTVGRVHQHVAPAAGAQRGLQPGEGDLALGAAVARQCHDAPGLRGQRLVQRASNGGQVLATRQKGRGKPELVEAGGRGARRARSLALQAAVGHVRDGHECTPHAALAQILQHLGQRGAHGSPARTGAQDNVGTGRRSQLVHQRRDARVPALPGKAPSYDKRIT